MKNILKSIVLPIIIATFIGYILGTHFYKEYQNNIYSDLRSSRLYLIQNGEYDTIESMREKNTNNNYVYYEDGNKYKTVIGITHNYDNIAKIKSLYNDSLEVTEYYIASEFLDTKQYEYDELLSKATNDSEVKEAVNNILNLYRTDNNIRLISIS